MSARDPGRRSSASAASDAARSASSSTTKKTSIASGGGRAPPSRLEREQQPLDPGAEADARRRRAADLLDQAVVAAAAADGRLRADRLVHELERRARVVVEAAHERRHELVRDAVGVEVRRARAAKCSRHASQSDSPIFGAFASAARTLFAFHVEDAQRARRALLPRLVVEDVLVLVEPGGQLLDVRGAGSSRSPIEFSSSP